MLSEWMSEWLWPQHLARNHVTLGIRLGWNSDWMQDKSRELRRVDI